MDSNVKDKQNELEKGLLPPNKLKNKEVRSQKIKLGIMISMTFLFFLVELFYGYFSNSVALIADAFHMLSDVLALGVALACILIARLKSTTNTFGWIRCEVLGALVNGVFLLALCFSIFLESVEHLLEPSELKEPLNVLVVGIIGLLVNLVGMFLFHSHSHGHSHNNESRRTDGIERSSYLASSHQDGAMSIAVSAIDDDNFNNNLDQEIKNQPDGKKSKSASHLNMKGVYLHIITDFIGSIIVIITSSISYFFPHLTLLKFYMDPALSIIMVILIMSSTIPLVHETALILLQTTPKDVDLNQIKKKLLETPGVLAVHELHVWRLVGVKIIATIHVRFISLDHYLKTAQQIRDIFHDNNIHSITIQPEFAGMIRNAESDQDCVLKCEPEDCKEAACC